MKRNQRINWEVVYDCDDEYGNPTVWCTEINHEKYGKYCWICFNGEAYEVQIDVFNDGCHTIKECKSLTSAKRWVRLNLF